MHGKSSQKQHNETSGKGQEWVRRPLTPEERALVWRFRWSLTGEPRALTKVLRCVDWGDAREARSAGDLIARWAPIGLADALELLSPAFSNPEVPPLLQSCMPC